MAKAASKAPQKTPKVKTASANKAQKSTVKPQNKIGAPAERAGNETLFWLFKSEPDKFSWADLVAKGEQGEEWDGVRNYQARNNMRKMRVGDLGFFYHSNAGKDIVGICEVCALAHQDSTTDDERWECVDVRALCDVPKPVTLSDVKAAQELCNMALVTSMRLSVQPVTTEEWAVVCRMGGLDPDKIKS